MKGKQMMYGMLFIASFMSSCDQAQQQAKEQTDKIVSQTSEQVKKVIDDLGLVYVVSS